MTPEERRAHASKGGKACVNRHRWTSDEARENGRKGGQAIVEKYGREHMAEMGRKGALKKESK